MIKPFQCVLFLILLSAASLVAQTHVAEPAVNLGDTSFLDGIGGPGVVIEAIGDGAHAGTVVDGGGKPISGTGAVNSISELTHIAWLTHRTILRGWYGTEVVAAAAHVNAGSAGQSGGWGAFTVSPFILQWSERKIGNVPIDQRIVLDFDLPVGAYTRSSSVNTARMHSLFIPITQSPHSQPNVSRPAGAVTIYGIRRIIVRHPQQAPNRHRQDRRFTSTPPPRTTLANTFGSAPTPTTSGKSRMAVSMVFRSRTLRSR
jgi:hypothetical protein